MIKTTQAVKVPTRNNRDIEDKIVYSKIEETAVRPNDYLPLVEEYVYDDIEYTYIDENEVEQVGVRQVKRILYKNTNAPLNISEIEGLISILKNKDILTNLGMSSLIGVYDSLPTLSEKMRFVMQFGLLVDYNQRQRRGVNWINE